MGDRKTKILEGIELNGADGVSFIDIRVDYWLYEEGIELIEVAILDSISIVKLTQAQATIEKSIEEADWIYRELCNV